MPVKTIKEIEIRCPICKEKHLVKIDDDGNADKNYGIIRKLESEDDDINDISYCSNYTLLGVCDSCKDKFSTCHICGKKITWPNIITHNTVSPCIITSKCESVICNKHKYNYSYEDKYKYYRLKSEPSPRLYYGIELETGINPNSNIMPLPYFIAKLPDCMFAHDDGSIHDSETYSFDESLEIVTHPMTYKWMRKHKRMWDDLFDLGSHGLIADDAGSCGMHIHISRKYFTLEELRQLGYFIHHHHHKYFLTKFSKRTAHEMDDWARFIYKSDIDYIINSCGGQDNEKFRALAYHKKHTIEFRLFNGTMDSTTFWGNIEFIQALVKMVKKGKTNISVSEYIEYVDKHKKYYPELINRLEEI